jgi:hypothetical protein
MKTLWISLATLLLPHLAAGQPVSAPEQIQAPTMSQPVLRAQLSSDEVTLGDTVHLFLTVEHPSGMSVNLPTSVDFGAAFEEVGRTSTRSVNSRGMATNVFELALMTFAVGQVDVPAVPVIYSSQGRAYEVATEPLPLTVASFVGSGSEVLREPGPPLSVVREDWRTAVGGGLILLIVLATGIGWRAFLRVPQPGSSSPTPRRRRSPLVEARIRFDELEASGLLDADDRRPAYVLLSEVVREFVGDQYGFNALDLTTSEILTTVSERLDLDEEAFLAAWLRETDLVKFAGFDATADEARQALYTARQWIEGHVEGGDA